MQHDLELAGPWVAVRPLRHDDAGDLARLSAASPTAREDLRWHTDPLPLDPDTAGANIARLLAHPEVMPLAVVGAEDGRVRGITSFYDHVASVPRVEIGHTQFARSCWGGVTNPATKLLLLAHACDVWGCVRVALRCDADNKRSAAAIRRLGAEPEGILRSHRRRHDGQVADTAYFAVTSSQWPHVRAGLEERLAAARVPDPGQDDGHTTAARFGPWEMT